LTEPALSLEMTVPATGMPQKEAKRLGKPQ